jgi:hypothetical protein
MTLRLISRMDDRFMDSRVASGPAMNNRVGRVRNHQHRFAARMSSRRQPLDRCPESFAHDGKQGERIVVGFAIGI